MTLLYTFAISHFSEKARWALDAEGIEYEERRLLPGPHMPTIRRIAPRTTVPVLRHGGLVIQGSSAIVDYIHERMGGCRVTPHEAADQERVRELEKLADHAFGLGVQRIFYATLLAERRTVTDLWTQGGPRWGPTFYRFGYPFVARAVARMYRTDPDSVDRAKERYEKAIERFDQMLAEQPFLGGDQPNRLDITVASLLAPMCRPPEHVLDWPELVEPMASFVRKFQSTRTWNHVLKMYAEHRTPALS